MNKLPLDLILDQYRAQRRYRENKRNQYLRRFEILKQSFPHVHHHHSHSNNPQEHHHHTHQIQHTQPRHHTGAANTVLSPSELHAHNHPQGLSHSIQSNHHNHLHHEHRPEYQHSQQGLEKKRLESEQFQLQRQNEELKKNLVLIETEERNRLQAFKSEIEEVRAKYIDEIKKLTETAKSSKDQIEAKLHKIKIQSEAAANKNIQIQQTNKMLKNQISEGNAMMGQYATQIKKQYSEKIVQFEKIFDSSNEKIEAMEKEFNEDEFIENTLKNEELLKSIEENAEKAEEAGKILEDYGALLEGKKEILTEINSNVEMKEKEIEKMIELQGKMKLIMDKLTSEKKIYVAENNKMAQELLEIKNLLMGVMNESK